MVFFSECATIPVNEGCYGFFSVILICPKLAQNLFVQGQEVLTCHPDNFLKS